MTGSGLLAAHRLHTTTKRPLRILRPRPRCSREVAQHEVQEGEKDGIFLLPLPAQQAGRLHGRGAICRPLDALVADIDAR